MVEAEIGISAFLLLSVNFQDKASAENIYRTVTVLGVEMVELLDIEKNYTLTFLKTIAIITLGDIDD